MGISAALGSSALLPAGLGFRNKIINGAMVVAQRGTSAVTGSGSAQYPLDRWIVYNGTGTVTFQQVALSGSTLLAGYTNALLVTNSNTAGAYGEVGYTQIGQYIEGYNVADLALGTASAKQIVLSFWARSSVTGTYNVALQNAAQSRSYVTTFAINAANTWEYKTIYVNGDTSGTWATDNTIGLRIWFNPGMGTTYDTTANTWVAASKFSTSDAVDFAANSGATFHITGVQLEQNYQPTPFEQRPIGVELALCQRYFVRFANTGHFYGVGQIIPIQAAYVVIPLPVPMRVAPTNISTTGTFLGLDATGTGRGFSSLAFSSSTENQISVHCVNGFNFTNGHAVLLFSSGSTSISVTGAEL